MGVNRVVNGISRAPNSGAAGPKVSKFAILPRAHARANTKNLVLRWSSGPRWTAAVGHEEAVPADKAEGELPFLNYLVVAALAAIPDVRT